MYIYQGEKCKGKKIHWCEAMETGKGKGTQVERAKARSKTFPGIAKAMAEQFTSTFYNPDKTILCTQKANGEDLMEC